MKYNNQYQAKWELGGVILQDTLIDECGVSVRKTDFSTRTSGAVHLVLPIVLSR